MPENTAGTGFAPGRVASAAPEAVGSCALTSDVSREVEQQHLARTEFGLAHIAYYPHEPSCTGPAW